MILPYKGPLKPGMMVVTGGDNGFVSRQVSRSTGSSFTHVFMVAESPGKDNDGLLVEAWMPRIRVFPLKNRLYELEQAGRQAIVLDGPFRNDELFIDRTRIRVVENALTHVGKRYDVGQAFLYWIGNQFRNDGEGKMVCSRLMTAAWYRNYRPLFTEDFLDDKYGHMHPRYSNLMQQWATPVDILNSRANLLGSLDGYDYYQYLT